MAFSVNTICCCNLLPNVPSPTSTNSSSSFIFPSHRRARLPVGLKNKFNHQISCSTQSQRKEEDESSWKRRSTQCVFGLVMACMIIDTSNLPVAFAADDSSFTTTTTTTSHQQATAAEKIQKKWSDKQRVCQPWRLNSLETIVPENLPRPSAHRRSESISSSTTTAPLVNSRVVQVQTNANNCFSM